ncbi:hypothetical protein EDD36DRAFT_74091 [Exophiala viscosa]|uniref:Uncharacterized protein n=1 Tax=Exophiala viscosa TaxID=2486360 RepID=A0AAN6DPA1_9EURO|nr:hypothetical protein EDD36DRAFT_74091 [Exophiala viscosa]
MLREDADRGSSLETMQCRLEDIPTTMADLFMELFHDFPAKDREEALRMWQWVILARRPLRLPELHEAMTSAGGKPRCKLDRQGQKHDSTSEVARYRLRILYLSRGLIDIEPAGLFVEKGSDFQNNGLPPIDGAPEKHAALWAARVQPIHVTVQEFSAEKGFLLFSNITGDNAIGQGHSILSLACFNYLGSEEARRANDDNNQQRRLKWQPPSSDLYLQRLALPLLVYAESSCLEHARQAEKLGFVATHFLQDPKAYETCFLPEWLGSTQGTLAAQIYKSSYSQPGPTLSFLCHNQLFLTAERLIDKPEFKVHSRNNGGNTPLHSIAWLDRRMDKKVAGLAEILMRRGADPKAQNFEGFTPVNLARWGNLEQTLKVLTREPSTARPEISSTETPEGIAKSRALEEMLLVWRSIRVER